MEKSKPQLAAERGYVKGTITRLYNFISQPEAVTTSSTETLISKKQRITTAFSQYESCNINIISIDPDDAEDVEQFENRYYAILSALKEELKKRDTLQSCPSPSPPISKLKLPPIDVPIFDGKFTEFLPFINLFNSVISDNKSVDLVQKLYYLRCYL